MAPLRQPGICRSPNQKPNQTAVTPPSPRNLDGIEPVLPGESTWGLAAEGPGPRGLALPLLLCALASDPWALFLWRSTPQAPPSA